MAGDRLERAGTSWTLAGADAAIALRRGAAGRYTCRVTRAYVAVVVVEAVVLAALWLLSRHFAA